MVGRVEAWRQVSETNVPLSSSPSPSFFPSSCVHSVGKGSGSLQSNNICGQGWRQAFDVTLETPLQERMF